MAKGVGPPGGGRHGQGGGTPLGGGGHGQGGGPPGWWRTWSRGWPPPPDGGSNGGHGPNSVAGHPTLGAPLYYIFNFNINLLSEKPIDECLKILVNKSTKLRELRISNNSGLISNRIFFALSEFRSLKRLEVLIFNRNRVEGSVECLKHMTRLKHLSITLFGQTLDFLANIQIHLPNIRYLKIFISDYDYTSILEPFLESLQTMKCIERVGINNNKKFYYNKNRSESKPRILLQ